MAAMMTSYLHCGGGLLHVHRGNMAANSRKEDTV